LTSLTSLRFGDVVIKRKKSRSNEMMFDIGGLEIILEVIGR